MLNNFYILLNSGTLNDIRGPPKKSGAGNGNWGVVGDEINTM